MQQLRNFKQLMSVNFKQLMSATHVEMMLSLPDVAPADITTESPEEHLRGGKGTEHTVAKTPLQLVNRR
jgi:hypothetical protein